MNKMHARRSLVLIAAGVALAVGLAACAAAPNGAAPAAPAARAATSAPAAAAAATEVPAAAAPAATELPRDQATSGGAVATSAPEATEAPATSFEVKATEAPAATEAPRAPEPPTSVEPSPALPAPVVPTAIPLATETPRLDDGGKATATAAANQQAQSSRPTATPLPLPPTEVATGATAPQSTVATVTPLATATPLATVTSEATATPMPEPTITAEAQKPADTARKAADTPVPIPTAAPPPLAQVVQPGQIEPRVVELEWPPSMRLGESGSVQLSLIPSKDGFTITTDAPGNQTITQTVEVKRPLGFLVNVIAQLDGIGFDIDRHEQTAPLPAGETVKWRWTISPKQAGQQRLSLVVLLRWTPEDATAQTAPQDSQVYSRGLSVYVNSVMGMTTSQASATGLLGLVLGSGMGALALAVRRNRGAALDVTKGVKANVGLAIEPQPGIKLGDDEQQMLRTLFRKYARVSVEREFRSGYSGARTLLCLPVRGDGRSDAYTIAKMGERGSIEREFYNYETFVKDTLPPVTARIQEPPVTLAPVGISSQAVLRYTFIGEPGKMPKSLRESLLTDPDPALLRKLFDTFGPNWWLQRRPYSFHLSQEYDRLLPSHFVIEPVEGGTRNATVLKGDTQPSDIDIKIGDLVTLRDFPLVELRPDGWSYSLTGQAADGQPPLRIRVSSSTEPRKPTQMYRVVGTRETLLRDFTRGFDLLGLPDPLAKLSNIEHRTISGTQSPIHGDLNLENVLVGPGGFVWLIDFANTRDGHPLFDFARLEAELVTQIAAPQMTAQDFVGLLLRLDAKQVDGGVGALIDAARDIARQCLFNPLQPNEYWLALYMACLGALKFTNLNAHQQHLLYLTAAHVSKKL